MISIKSENGVVDIKMNGGQDRIVADLGVAICKIFLILSNRGKDKAEVLARYTKLIGELVKYLEETVRKVDESTSVG